jgi:hypothetical protein
MSGRYARDVLFIARQPTKAARPIPATIARVRPEGAAVGEVAAACALRSAASAAAVACTTAARAFSTDFLIAAACAACTVAAIQLPGIPKLEKTMKPVCRIGRHIVKFKGICQLATTARPATAGAVHTRPWGFAC